MNIQLSNWRKPAHEALVMASGIVGSATAFTPQLLSVLHESPFPVSPLVDEWVEWILKLATVCLAGLTIFSKKQEA